MPINQKIRQRFRGAVVGALGARTKRPLSRETPPKIQKMFHPYSRGGEIRAYPRYQMLHELSKMPMERIFRFVKINDIRNEVIKQPGVARLIKQYPELNKELEGAIREAVRERGIKGAKFWKKAPKSYIDQIVAAGRKNPVAMNERAGEIIAQRLGTELRPRTILDIGTFSGATIGAVVDKFSPEQRKLLKLVLVDVAGKNVRAHAVPFLIEKGVPKENITVIPASFYSVAVAFKQMKRPMHEARQKLFLKELKKLAGKVDAITAGAATINFAVDLKPYLQSIKTLLKPGGVFVNWDWGSAEVMRPKVNPKALKKVPIGYTQEGIAVPHYDAYVSFMNFWLKNTLNYPQSVVDKFIMDLNSSKKFSSFEWLEKNAAWAEKERETQVWKDTQGVTRIGKPRITGPLPIRNRAYRTPSSMYNAAVKEGFATERAVLPFAKPGELNTGNVNWMIVLTKK